MTLGEAREKIADAIREVKAAGFELTEFNGCIWIHELGVGSTGVDLEDPDWKPQESRRQYADPH